MINEAYLWMSFIGLCVICIIMVWIPFRSAQVLSIRYFFWGLIALLCIIFAYLNWGSWGRLHDYHTELKRQEKINKLITKLPDRDHLITKLRQHLDLSPKSARGWYLLGRLYASEGQWLSARDAFAMAQKLNPNDQKAQLQYALTVWQLNHQQLDDSTRPLFMKILAEKPNQPDTLAVLALDAYSRNDYAKAIQYWKRLLVVLPAESEEANATRQWIAKAYQHLPAQTH